MDTRGTVNIHNFNKKAALEISCKFHPALFPSNNKVDKLLEPSRIRTAFRSFPKVLVSSCMRSVQSDFWPGSAPLLRLLLPQRCSFSTFMSVIYATTSAPGLIGRLPSVLKTVPRAERNQRTSSCRLTFGRSANSRTAVDHSTIGAADLCGSGRNPPIQPSAAWLPDSQLSESTIISALSAGHFQ